jgi:hypothetical protein
VAQPRVGRHRHVDYDAPDAAGVVGAQDDCSSPPKKKGNRNSDFDVKLNCKIRDQILSSKVGLTTATAASIKFHPYPLSLSLLCFAKK